MLDESLPDVGLGKLQSIARQGDYPDRSVGTLWLCALENPARDRNLMALRIGAKPKTIWRFVVSLLFAVVRIHSGMNG